MSSYVRLHLHQWDLWFFSFTHIFIPKSSIIFQVLTRLNCIQMTFKIYMVSKMRCNDVVKNILYFGFNWFCICYIILKYYCCEWVATSMCRVMLILPVAHVVVLCTPVARLRTVRLLVLTGTVTHPDLHCA
jgi:hypothetical protein